MKLILRFSPSCDLHQGEKELFNYLPQSTIQVEENDPFPLGVGGGLPLITPFTAAHTHIATPIPKKNSGRGGGGRVLPEIFTNKCFLYVREEKWLQTLRETINVVLLETCNCLG